MPYVTSRQASASGLSHENSRGVTWSRGRSICTFPSISTLITMPEPGQESLVQAYLPLLEQWEAQGLVEATVGKLRRPMSF